MFKEESYFSANKMRKINNPCLITPLFFLPIFMTEDNADLHKIFTINFSTRNIPQTL